MDRSEKLEQLAQLVARRHWQIVAKPDEDVEIGEAGGDAAAKRAEVEHPEHVGVGLSASSKRSGGTSEGMATAPPTKA